MTAILDKNRFRVVLRGTSSIPIWDLLKKLEFPVTDLKLLYDNMKPCHQEILHLVSQNNCI